jgi:hypothetical protein
VSQVRILPGAPTDQQVSTVEEISAIRDLRIRWIGHTLRAEADVTVSPSLTVVEAHDVAHHAEAISWPTSGGSTPPPSTSALPALTTTQRRTPDDELAAEQSTQPLTVAYAIVRASSRCAVSAARLAGIS